MVSKFDSKYPTFAGATETGRRVIYPWLCDQMGHLATQHYMAFFDDAFYHFLSILGPINIVEGEQQIGWADVRHEVDYLSELKSGDLVVLRSWVLNLGTKSITHVTDMCQATNNTVCARVVSRTVRFDLGLRRAIPIETAIRDRVKSRGLEDFAS